MIQEQLALQWLGEAIRKLGLGWAVHKSDVLLSDVILQETESHLVVLGCAPVAQLGSLRDAGSIVLEQYDRWLASQDAELPQHQLEVQGLLDSLGCRDNFCLGSGLGAALLELGCPRDRTPIEHDNHARLRGGNSGRPGNR